MSQDEKAPDNRVTDMLRWQFGPDICTLFEDDSVIEIMLNPDGKLWVERLGKDMEEAGTMSPSKAESLMGTLASLQKDVLTDKNPSISCELPREFAGARFQGDIPPVVEAPSFNIRKKAIAIFTLQEYVDKGIMTQRQREVIEAAVRNKKNILIAGGTGSGKTTLTNAVIKYVSDACPQDRLIILEDTRELQCTAKNYVKLLVTPERSMAALLQETLRKRPDRILVGEVRNGAALDLLMAWNTGHPGGVCTGHANSAYDSLIRIEQLVAMVSPGPMQTTIGSAVNLIVFIEKCAGSRKVTEILEVEGHDGLRYITRSTGEKNV